MYGRSWEKGKNVAKINELKIRWCFKREKEQVATDKRYERIISVGKRETAVFKSTTDISAMIPAIRSRNDSW